MNQAELAQVVQQVREHDARQREARQAELPKVRLSERHMSNCRLVLNRSQLLRHMPASAVAAELGVDRGGFSEEILSVTNPTRLHLVDLWNSSRYHSGLFEGVCAKFGSEIEAGRVHIHRKDSIAAVQDFEDGYFDWIYIDTDHSYATTAKELRRYAPKMKPGGMITGHDYIIGNWVNSYRYGVIEAVHEFCVECDWELVFLTVDPFESQSFAIRRL